MLEQIYWYLIVGFSILLPAFMVYIQIVASKFKQTDQIFHLVLIELIRKNKHLFINEFTGHLYCKKGLYPQLLHWILSFMSPKMGAVTGKYISAIAALLSAMVLAGFALFFLPSIIGAEIPMLKVFIMVMAVYILTPYTFNMDNAKNVGMSVRGVGLLLSQLYIYALIWYVHTQNYWCLVFATGAALLIILANIFSFQFLLFSAPLFAYFYSDWLLVLPLVISMVLFIAFMPKYSIRYLKGQWEHKRLYANHIAGNSILKLRYSIWRDWIFDFWKAIYLFITGKSNALDMFRYIYGNSAVSIIVGMPFIVIVLIYFGLYLYEHPAIYLDNTNPYYLLSVPTITCILVFIATSFRPTRFLGEPERYAEIALAFAALSVPLFFPNDTTFLITVLAFCLLAIALQFFVFLKFVVKRRSTGFSDKLEKLNEHVLKLDVVLNHEMRLLSNNLEVCRFFMSTDRQIFGGIGIPEYFGELSYNEVFEEIPFINKAAMVPLIKQFDVNCLVIEIDKMPEYKDILEEDSLVFEEIHIENNFIMYKVAPKR